MRIFSGYRFFCSSVPYAMMVGPAMPTPSTLSIGGAFWSAISSCRIVSSTNVRPWPPYSLGQVAPMRPPSCIFFCHLRRNS
ncbi:MAG: hypothetical protein DMD78_29280 [Candidatus Rokuibacteriota bacterium]|nr:MAG: hypothetical protein DMD78_29280 [Candidatus Rokubacteria bacterium]